MAALCCGFILFKLPLEAQQLAPAHPKSNHSPPKQQRPAAEQHNQRDEAKDGAQVHDCIERGRFPDRHEYKK